MENKELFERLKEIVNANVKYDEIAFTTVCGYNQTSDNYTTRTIINDRSLEKRIGDDDQKQKATVIATLLIHEAVNLLSDQGLTTKKSFNGNDLDDVIKFIIRQSV